MAVTVSVRCEGLKAAKFSIETTLPTLQQPAGIGGVQLGAPQLGAPKLGAPKLGAPQLGAPVITPPAAD